MWAFSWAFLKSNFILFVKVFSLKFTNSDINSFKFNIFGFPSTIANLQDPYILKNLRGQTVDFYPIQYNPVQKILRVYSEITVKVYAEGESSLNVLQRKSGKQVIAREYKNIYEGHFLNYRSDNRFDYIDDHGNFLIISYGSFMEEMQPFIDWKSRKGVPVSYTHLTLPTKA